MSIVYIMSLCSLLKKNMIGILYELHVYVILKSSYVAFINVMTLRFVLVTEAHSSSFEEFLTLIAKKCLKYLSISTTIFLEYYMNIIKN
jgi:hypothetical protein